MSKGRRCQRKLKLHLNLRPTRWPWYGAQGTPLWALHPSLTAFCHFLLVFCPLYLLWAFLAFCASPAAHHHSLLQEPRVHRAFNELVGNGTMTREEFWVKYLRSKRYHAKRKAAAAGSATADELNLAKYGPPAIEVRQAFGVVVIAVNDFKWRQCHGGVVGGFPFGCRSGGAAPAMKKEELNESI